MSTLWSQEKHLVVVCEAVSKVGEHTPGCVWVSHRKVVLGSMPGPCPFPLWHCSLLSFLAAMREQLSFITPLHHDVPATEPAGTGLNPPKP